MAQGYVLTDTWGHSYTTMNVYLDNAATTLLDKEVLEAMLPYMKHLCGSPSAIHSYGRKAKAPVEKTRKQIATLLKAAPAEIFLLQAAQRAIIWCYAVPFLGKNVTLAKQLCFLILFACFLLDFLQNRFYKKLLSSTFYSRFIFQ